MVDLKKTPPLLGRRTAIAAAAGLERRGCKDCGAALPAHAGAGRPPTYCEECKPKSHKATVTIKEPPVSTWPADLPVPAMVEGTLEYSEPIHLGAIHGTPDPGYKASESELQSAMDDLVTARRDLAAAKARLARLLEGV